MGKRGLSALNILNGMHLEEYDIIKVDAQRHVPISKALRGRFEHNVTMTVDGATRRDKHGILSVINMGIKAFGREDNEESKEVLALTLEVAVEGFFLIDKCDWLLAEEDLTDAHAHAAVLQLQPLVVTFTNQYLASMGYKAITIPLGPVTLEQMEQIDTVK
jgi:hypothetical protein